jgi:hypothetical protein
VRDHAAQLAAAFPARSPAIRSALADAAQPFPGDGILWIAGSPYPSADSPVSTS